MGLTKWPGSKPDAHTPELVARLLNALKPPTILRQFSHSDSNGAETNFVYNKLRRDAIWQKKWTLIKHLTIVWNFKKVVASTWEKTRQKNVLVEDREMWDYLLISIFKKYSKAY